MITKKKSVLILSVVLPFYLLVLLFSAHAFTPPVQAGKPNIQPNVSNKVKYDPNAPPQGTITITKPQAGTTWATGAYGRIEWTCNGTRSNGVNLTLWRGGQQFSVIRTDVWTGRMDYVVPPGTPAGNYEVRVTSINDARIEDRRPVTIVATTLTLATPPASLMSGTRYDINWTYTGNPPSALKLSLLDSNGYVLKVIDTNISTGSNGKGRYPWTVPKLPYDKYKLSASAAQTGQYLSSTDRFIIMDPEIKVGSFSDWQYSAGAPAKITWTTNLAGEPFKVELYSTANSSVLQVIKSSVTSAATNTLNWTIPSNLPANLYGTGFQIRITSLNQGSIQASNDPFVIAKSGLNITAPDPARTLAKNVPCQIAWKYTGNPGAHVRIDLFASASATVPTWTITGSTGVGTAGTGQFAWNGDGMFSKQVYLQVQSVETPAVKDRRLYTTTATGTGSGTTTGTVTTGTTTTGTGGTTKHRLASDTTYHYNASRSATFRNGSVVTLDSNNYVLEGQIAGDAGLYYQANKYCTFYGFSIATFKNGYVEKGQLLYDESLEYRSGKSVSLLGHSVVTFDNGYVASGQLAREQSLEYRAGKTANFYTQSVINFKNGYVQKGQLFGDQSLEYKAGKTVRLFTNSIVTFDNGYVASGQLTGDQSLEYKSGKTAQFLSSSVTTFKNGYVASGQLAREQSLEYRAGKSATFTTITPITFRDDGYVKSCQLAYDTYLEHAPGQSVKWPAGRWPVFNDAGYTTNAP